MTDDDGATGSAAKNVAPTNPPGRPATPPTATAHAPVRLGQRADRWRLDRRPARRATSPCGNGAAGRSRNAAGAGPAATLAGVSASDADQLMTFGLDKPATGGGIYLYSYGRRVTGQGSYFAKAKVGSAGEVTLALSRTNLGRRGGQRPGGHHHLRAHLLGRRSAERAGPDDWIRPRRRSGPRCGRSAPSSPPAGSARRPTPRPACRRPDGGCGLLLSSTANNAPITVLIDQFTTTAP